MATDFSNSSPPWIELPGDVTANILHRIGVVEILESAQKVCTTWWKVCQDPTFWRVIDMKNLDNPNNVLYVTNICCLAVDRSQGELIDISIGRFGTDQLLHYISQRSSHLRRLSVARCERISSRGLSEAVHQFPELEELHLFFMSQINPEAIETIGLSSPKLKTFTFNDGVYATFGFGILTQIGTSSALAVAKSMPNLCHLRLIGNLMTNEGLEAILDRCPHLESLDLRKCSTIDLGGELGKRCSRQIKHLRRPSDSTSDYEFDGQLLDDFTKLVRGLVAVGKHLDLN